MTRRVLVTRPQPGADETAARIAALGFSTVVLPLTGIVPVAPDRLPDPATIDAVVVTSVNAPRHAPAALLRVLEGRTLFAVGEASAAAARAAGFRDVRSAGGSAGDLAALIGRDLRPGARLLHLAGTERTAGFEADLRRRGMVLDVVELYRAEKISYPPDFVKGVLADDPIWGAPVFSPRGGALLAGLVATGYVRETFENTRFFCISTNAASPLLGLAGPRVSVAGAPTEDGVLALLSSQE